MLIYQCLERPVMSLMVLYWSCLVSERHESAENNDYWLSIINSNGKKWITAGENSPHLKEQRWNCEKTTKSTSDEAEMKDYAIKECVCLWFTNKICIHSLWEVMPGLAGLALKRFLDIWVEGCRTGHNAKTCLILNKFWIKRRIQEGSDYTQFRGICSNDLAL